MPQILLFSGFATDHTPWIEQSSLLQKNSIELVYDIKDIKKDSKFYIMGWSLGGARGIKFALDNPSNIAGIILVSSFPKFFKEDGFDGGLPRTLFKNLERRIQREAKSGLEFFYKLITDEIDWLKLFLKYEIEVESVLEELKEIEFLDIREELSKIKTPTLIIHGDKDKVVPIESGLYLRDHIVKSKFKAFNGNGHAPFIDRPKEFNKIVTDFVLGDL